MKLRKGLSVVCGILAVLFLAAGSLAGLIRVAGISQPIMLRQLERWAPPDRTGLPAELYPETAEMITRYLAGDLDTFQLTVTDHQGNAGYLFHDYEQTHMADCRALFVLDRNVLLVSLAGMLISLTGLILLRDIRHGALGATVGAVMVLLPVIALVIWGLIDFDSLFILFHHLSFTNDLWLLDPRTDLLIRLMPLGFFTSYAAGIAICWLLLLLLTGTAALLGCRTHRD